MYLSAERIAVANQAIRETFEQTSIAWQAIPHWDTGDPGATFVRADDVNAPAAAPLPFVPKNVPFTVTLAQAIAPTPDALLAQVMDKTVDLAATFDEVVLKLLRAGVPEEELKGTTPDKILDSLINARALVENAGYRAPSCLITNTQGLKKLNALSSGYSSTVSLLTAANTNSLHRASQLDEKKGTKPMSVMLMLGRRQRIAPGAAAEASPGEEPVDIAVSVCPSLEVIGETPTNDIDLAVRITFATRIKDKYGVVAIVDET